MLEHAFPLSRLPVGNRARVLDIQSGPGMKRRLMDLGLTRDTMVEAVQKSPFGDPTAYLVRGAVIALRAEDADGVYLAGQNATSEAPA